METSHRLHERPSIFQQEKYKKTLENILEYQRLEKLKVALRAKLEHSLMAYKNA